MEGNRVLGVKGIRLFKNRSKSKITSIGDKLIRQGFIR